MRVLEDLKIGEGELSFLRFLQDLPERGKCLLLAAMQQLANYQVRNLSNFWLMGFSDYSECESPIEKILYLAMDIADYLRVEDFDGYRIHIIPQAEIKEEDFYCRVDFAVVLEDDANPGGASYDVIIECDGHDFHHKTKQQVKYDNERDMKLKLFGYEVLRFSGTQIYENPMKCANDIFDYLITKIKSR